MSWLLLPLALLLGWREWLCRRQMIAFGQPPRSAARLAYDLCSLAAMLLLLQPAAAGTMEQSRQDISLAVAIDVSPSMGLTTGDDSRIDLARQELLALLDALPGARIALVPFAGKPVVQVPLTSDHEAVTFFLTALEPGQIAAPGTGPEEAALLAQQLLKELPGETAVLLISDGERTLPIPPPELRPQIPVFSLLPGGLEPQAVPGRMIAGQPATSKPDPVRLEQLAAKTGGRFLPASTTALAIDSLLAQWQQGAAATGHENFWPALALALLLLRYLPGGDRRRPARMLPALGLLALLACNPQRPGEDGQALFEQALRQSPGEPSTELFHRAASLLDSEARAVALHNACSDALQAGQPELARRFCEESLLIRQGLPGTTRNLSLALRQLQDMPPGAGESEQQTEPTAAEEGEGLSAAQARRMVREIRVSPFAATGEEDSQPVEIQVERNW